MKKAMLAILTLPLRIGKQLIDQKEPAQTFRSGNAYWNVWSLFWNFLITTIRSSWC